MLTFSSKWRPCAIKHFLNKAHNCRWRDENIGLCRGLTLIDLIYWTVYLEENRMTCARGDCCSSNHYLQHFFLPYGALIGAPPNRTLSSPPCVADRTSTPDFCFSQMRAAVEMKASSTPSALFADASIYSRPLSSANACPSSLVITRLIAMQVMISGALASVVDCISKLTWQSHPPCCPQA